MKQTSALRCVPALSVEHWKQLQQEKDQLERRFEAELQGLRSQQQRELAALEERLKAQHTADKRSLQAQQRAELQELRVQQEEEVCLGTTVISLGVQSFWPRRCNGLLSASLRSLRR